MKVKGTKSCRMQPAPKVVHPQPRVSGRGMEWPRFRRKRRGLGVSRSPRPWESEDPSGTDSAVAPELHPEACRVDCRCLWQKRDPSLLKTSTCCPQGMHWSRRQWFNWKFVCPSSLLSVLWQAAKRRGHFPGP